MSCVLAIVAAAAASLAGHVSGYPAIGEYMPVSNVLEHSQISLDVKAFSEKLKNTPDYAGAKHIYTKGGGNSCKSSTKARTLQGFARKDMSGQTFYDTFINSGLPKNWWDDWMLAALDGTGIFNGLSRLKRVTCLNKGVLGLVTLYASYELEDAINKAKDVEKRSDSGSAHAWDEGWAFYYGASDDGANSPWEVAKKRDANFPDGLQVQTAIVPYFNAGLVAVRAGTYDASAAAEARDAIYTLWAVTYLRAALKYLELTEHTYNDKTHAEGFAYYMAIAGWVHSKNQTVALLLGMKLEITQTSIPEGSYCEVKAQLEAAYPAMGLNCSTVGTFADSVITCPGASTCSESAAALPTGLSAVDAVDGSATTDMTCEVAADSDKSDESGDSVSCARHYVASILATASVVVATLLVL